jgi:hypothetical protein
MPGENNLYVAFWAINEPMYINGQIHSDLLTLQLLNSLGYVLVSNQAYVSSASGQGIGVEYYGTMPTVPLTLLLKVTP